MRNTKLMPNKLEDHLEQMLINLIYIIQDLKADFLCIHRSIEIDLIIILAEPLI